MSRFNFDEPYEFQGLEPQEIRIDFSDYVIETCHNLEEAEHLIYALASYFPADKLGQFLDDRMMGRV